MFWRGTRLLGRAVSIALLSVSIWSSTSVILPAKSEALLGEMALGYVVGNIQYYEDLQKLNKYLFNAQYQADGVQDVGRISDDTIRTSIIDNVMTQLVNQGFYVMDEYSLPFRYYVIEDTQINAGTTPVNNIFINEGLMDYVHDDVDELAATMGHEMTHGLRHHKAKEWAKTRAMNLVNKAIFDGSGYENLIHKIEDSYISRNINIPDEHESDEEGFYIMSSAGFNPGGMPAMQYKLWQYEVDSGQIYHRPANPTHPFASKRYDNTIKYLTQYSLGHVRIKNLNEVYIDNNLLLVTQGNEVYTPAEQACMIAGGLAKAFHDYRLLTMWELDVDSTDFLNDNRVYRPLKEAVCENNLIPLLSEYVTAAYKNDSITHERDKIYGLEIKRISKWKEENAKAKEFEKEDIERFKVNAQRYNSLGLGEHAVNLSNRLLEAVPENTEIYPIRAEGYLKSGEYRAAIADCDKSIALDPLRGELFALKAASECMINNITAAAEDYQRAQALGVQIPLMHFIEGSMYDRAGDEANAELSFVTYLLQEKSNLVPEKYLTRIETGKKVTLPQT